MVRSTWGVGMIAAAWLASAPAAAGDLETGPVQASAAFRVRIEKKALSHAVGRALQGAVRRLQTPACTAVFSDFKDAAGRPLRAALDGLGQSGAGYMSLIGFYDGGGHATCLRDRVLAITSPGSRNVWVCPQFTLEQRLDPGLAEASLIHEALHSLGLEENPPSAGEITATVVARCGR